MSSGIKIFLLLLIFSVFNASGQEKAKEEAELIKDPQTVFFDFGIFRPLAIGDYSLARDYNLKLGFAFDFNWFLLPEFTLGAHFDIFKGDVEDVQRIGNIESTTINVIGVAVGYYHEFDPEWNIHVTTGIGRAEYVNRAHNGHFSEKGPSYWFQIQAAHRFNKTVAIYFKAGPRYDKLNIDAPPSIDKFINNQLLLNMGMGFRINLQNPGG